MLYLYDDSLAIIGALREYDAIVETAKMFEASTIDVKCHDYAAISQATYCATGDRLYRIEQVTLSGREVVVGGRDAIVDLESRAITAAQDFTGTSGAFIAAILATLTGSRATNVTAGNLTGGTSATRHVEPGVTVYDEIRELAAADGLGLRSRVSGSTLYLDLIVPSTSTLELGDALRNVTDSTHETDISAWRNYAIVVGQYGASTVTVNVDQTSGGERRELYVTAQAKQGTLSLADYQADLAAEGAMALADTRKVDYVAAASEADVSVGDVVWYDGGTWSGWLLCAEHTETRERGLKKRATLGEPPATLKKTLRRTR